MVACYRYSHEKLNILKNLFSDPTPLPLPRLGGEILAAIFGAEMLKWRKME
jgi:hypothetical protein